MPLARSALIALFTTFSVGYSSGVVNAAAVAAFPGMMMYNSRCKASQSSLNRTRAGHSTLAWSFSVSVFAIGAPFGAMAGGKLAGNYITCKHHHHC